MKKSSNKDKKKDIPKETKLLTKKRKEKKDVFFILNSLFCLKENSWKLRKIEFYKKYFESIKKKIYF